MAARRWPCERRQQSLFTAVNEKRVVRHMFFANCIAAALLLCLLSGIYGNGPFFFLLIYDMKKERGVAMKMVGYRVTVTEKVQIESLGNVGWGRGSVSPLWFSKLLPPCVLA